MTRRLAEDLLRLPVRTRGIEIGHPVDIIVDAAGNRALGFDVICRDDARRFLPLSAAQLEADAIAVESPLVLLAEDQLDFYRERGKSLREVMPVLENVVVRRDGLLELVSDTAA